MLETERLFMRKFTPEDLPTLIELRSPPEVHKYLGGSRMQNAEALEKRMQFYIDCHEKYGFGHCLMFWKETGEAIGWSGLQPLEDTGEIEVGYGMKQEFWRRGIGYECALAWLKFGFEKANLKRIVAIAFPENTGSWRIMQKLGMKYEKNEEHYGFECVFYAMSKEEYLNLHK